MSRDIEDRLKLFCGFGVEVRRLALNMDQIRRYSPPPNPAKITDSRAVEYIRQFGRESWELDALDPATLVALVRENVMGALNRERWEQDEKRENAGKKMLEAASSHWPELEELLGSRL